MSHRSPDIVVIGGGPAGLAAASAAQEAGACVALIDRSARLGGILNQCIHDGFGLHNFGEALTGPEFAARYVERALNAGVDVRTDTLVTGLHGDLELTCSTRGRRYDLTPRAVVMAMGCRERTRGMLRIAGSRPAGIYTAGTAQYLTNEMNILVGRRVVILGSGDIGLIMARRLTWEGVEVVAVVEKLAYASGLARNVRQCLDDYGIPLHLSCTVTEIHGDGRIQQVSVSRVDEHGCQMPDSGFTLSCDTLLLSVGLIPENELARQAKVALEHSTGGARVDFNLMTSISGIFSCGNVLQIHDVADWAALEGERAGRNAALYSSGRLAQPLMIPVDPGAGVRYVIPNLVPSTGEGFDLWLRVTDPGLDRVIRVCHDDEIILEKGLRRVAPAEMIQLKVPPTDVVFHTPLEVRAI